MNPNNDVVYRRLRLGPLHQLHPGRSRSLVRHHNRLHRPPPCVVKLGQRVPLSNLSRPPKCRSALSTRAAAPVASRSEEHTPEPPSPPHLLRPLLLLKT